ncbi:MULTISPECIES: pathogenicity island protein [Staphylococcus]|uniref:Pathogenicity island protein n=1 Tax=Staphylococcus hsinchuensis TaxID=3051183 RepID=A0ABZ3ED78_9STAP|nr:pathogenicity island protein [Staphylococcus sp. Marseille-Q6910]
MSTTKEVPTRYLQVYNIIDNTPDTYITNKKIINILGLEYNANTERWLRQVINELVELYRYPIGCSYKKYARGYYIIRTPEQKEEAMRSIRVQINGSLKRYDALKEMEIMEVV